MIGNRSDFLKSDELQNVLTQVQLLSDMTISRGILLYPVPGTQTADRADPAD